MPLVAADRRKNGPEILSPEQVEVSAGRSPRRIHVTISWRQQRDTRAAVEAAGTRGYPCSPWPRGLQLVRPEHSSRRSNGRPCDLLLRSPHGKKQSSTDYMTDLVGGMHHIHHHTRQDPEIASDRTRPANSAGFQQGKRV
jgi:hypothetical protein